MLVRMRRILMPTNFLWKDPDTILDLETSLPYPKDHAFVSSWVARNPSPFTIEQKREFEYIKRGVTLDNMLVALWERLMEADNTDSDDLQIIRDDVKVIIRRT